MNISMSASQFLPKNPFPMTVEKEEVSFGEDALDLAMGVWMMPAIHLMSVKSIGGKEGFAGCRICRHGGGTAVLPRGVL